MNVKIQILKFRFQILDSNSHLSSSFIILKLWKAIVKVHRVLPSTRQYSASARRLQFHSGHLGDSGAIVTPFMRDRNYLPMNFATLGLLELQPPFTRLSIPCIFENKNFLLFWSTYTFPLKRLAPGRHQTLYFDLSTLQSLVFLLNSRHPLVFARKNSRIQNLGSRILEISHPFFRSYGIILPSSFKMDG